MSKVVVGYPVGGSMTVPFGVSLARLIQHESEKPFFWLNDELAKLGSLGRSIMPGEIRDLLLRAVDQTLLAGVQHVSGLYVGENRNTLVQYFLKANADWLLMIDTDILFQNTVISDLLTLAGDDKKILAASVPLDDDPSCAYLGGKALDWVPSEPIEVDWVATACVLVHRDVFQAIEARDGQRWFHHTYEPDPKQPGKFVFGGEDMAFCKRAQEFGFKSWCVNLPGLAHFKTRPLSHDYAS